MGYLLHRILSTLPVMGVVAVVVFMLIHLSPGDPAALIAGDLATVHCRLSRKHLGPLREDPEIEIRPYVATTIGRHGAEGAVGEVA